MTENDDRIPKEANGLVPFDENDEWSSPSTYESPVNTMPQSSSCVGDDDEPDLSETEQAVASAAALVGETIIESPTTTRNAKTVKDFESFAQNYKMRELIIAGEKQQQQTQEQGRLARYADIGMDWWQARQKRIQRENLKKQVEEQRRILYQAEVRGSRVKASSLQDNKTFQHLANQPVPSDEDGPFKVSASESGTGVSLHVAVHNNDDDDDWIPDVKVVAEAPTAQDFCPYIINDPVQLQQIAQLVVPPTVAYCPWKRVYSLARDGDAFDAFLRLVEKVPHSLLVVRTTKNEIFGGYADSPWEAQHQGNPEFYGSAQACLFRIDEQGGVNAYKWTGANRYIQYVDVSHKMLALGGGGDDGAFGLCLEQDFQRGSTGRCATFDNEPLCPEHSFQVVDIECYAFLTGQF